MTDFHIYIHNGPGGLLPAEALRLASLAGYRAVALLVRSDGFFAPDARLGGLKKHVHALSLHFDIHAFLGVELAHLPPPMLPDAVRQAREAGAELVLVHGETITDQVEPGINLAAVDAGADILAHPGLLDANVAAYAAEKGVALELTSCPRHGLTNAHVALMAERHGCALVHGGNITAQDEFLSRSGWDAVCRGAGLSETLRAKMRQDAEALVQRLLRRKSNPPA